MVTILLLPFLILMCLILILIVECYTPMNLMLQSNRNTLMLEATWGISLATRTSVDYVYVYDT